MPPETEHRSVVLCSPVMRTRGLSAVLQGSVGWRAVAAGHVFEQSVIGISPKLNRFVACGTHTLIMILWSGLQFANSLACKCHL